MALLHRLQRYGALFPGGAHREEALRIELLTLFELGSLDGGDFRRLQDRVAEYMRHPPCASAPHEAAYWATVILEPSGDEPAFLDDRLAAAWADYVQRYPDSRYTPRLTRALFENAEAADDLPAMERLAAAMERHFPERAGTRLLAARLRRHNAVGHPFWLGFRAGEETVDTRRHAGSPVMIVVWSSGDRRSEDLCREIAAFEARHAEVAVFGVCLDYDREALERFVRQLGVDWPQFFDGRGPANEFALTWGVTRTPTVFVVDRGGRLLGAAGASTAPPALDAWKTLAEKALEN